MKHKAWILWLACIGFLPTAMAHQEKDDSDNPIFSGTVVEAETGKPLKNVNVTIYQSSRKEKVVQTSDDGSFRIDALKPGTYKVVFEKNGYRRITRDKLEVRPKPATPPSKTGQSVQPVQLKIEMPEKQGDTFDFTPSLLQFFGAI